MPVAPVAMGSDPYAGPPVVTDLQILIMIKVNIPLQKPKAQWRLAAKSIDQKPGWIHQRMPDPFTRPGIHRKPVRIMNLRPKITITFKSRILPVKKHGTQRRDPYFLNMLTNKKHAVDFHHRLNTRLNRELICPGHAIAVKKGIDLDALGPRRRMQNPKLTKKRELFPRILSRIDTKPPGRNPVGHVPAQRTKITGAKECHKLVGIFRRVQRIMDPKAAKTIIL